MFIDSTEEKERALVALNKVLEAELTGVIQYTYYSFMIYGYHRIPIVTWLKEQASESLMHAQQAGEIISGLDGHPSFNVENISEKKDYSISYILKKSLDHEIKAMRLYRDLLDIVEGKSILLEEYARSLILAEEQHILEVNKMLKA